MIIVVAALIKRENKILIAKRSTGDKSVNEKWEFPGGKLEPNETEKEAIEREILEEFEMHIKAQKFLINNIYKCPSKTIDLRLYECDYLDGEFKLHDHSEYAWVTIDQLLEYELCPADIPIAKYIEENNI